MADKIIKSVLYLAGCLVLYRYGSVQEMVGVQMIALSTYTGGGNNGRQDRR